VLPGFYDVLRKGPERSAAGAIFCRYAAINSKRHWLDISELYRESAGLLEDWHARITVQQLIQCPAIVVRRLMYEQVCGFLPQLYYVPRLGNVATNCLSIFVLVRALDPRLLSGASELYHFASET